MTMLKVTTIDNQLAVVLSPELAAQLRATAGSEVSAISTSCGIELSSGDPEVARQLEAARRVMREDREVLSRLAE